MKNFKRVLLIAARRKFALAGVLFTAFAVAMLWGANIGMLYPMIEIVFNEDHDSLSDYSQFRIDQAQNEIAGVDVRLSELKDQIAKNPSRQTELSLIVEKKITEREVHAQSIKYLVWFQPILNRYTPQGSYSTLLLLIGLLVLATAVKLIALGANLLLVQYVSERTSLDLRNEFFRKTLHLDLESFGENGSADLTSRLTNDVSNVSAGVSVLLGRMLREPLKMIVCLAGAFAICPRLLLLIMVVTPIIAVIMQHLSRAIRRASRKAMEEMSQIYGLLNNSFAGIRVVKAFNTQAAERAKFKIGTRRFYRKSMKMAFYNVAARSSSEMLGICTVSLGIIAGGYLAMGGHTHLLNIRMTEEPLGFAPVLLFFVFLIGASDPAKKLTDVWSNLQRGIAAADRVYSIIDRTSRVSEPTESAVVARPHSTLKFENIHYQYPSGPKVLRGIDLNIRHGETVALVGPNGCGKSTLISLLCRFDDPLEGEIMIDDVPINQLRTRELRKRIALVTQRTMLFDDTIENNIRYGTPGADDHAVARAAKMAFADDFIRHKTPNGYETMLGNDGMRLSGGQMQRIALARAFLRNPDILILDEATSQIDLESEQLIHEALAKFLVDRTGIMITHRPTSLAMADRVVVIEHGQIADSGSHGHLIGQNRFYQSLCGSETTSSRAA